MGFTQAFKLAFKSLSGSKMRAFLTMLGIIIGVASVIILVSLMQGMTGEVTSMFEDMGTNTLTVSVTGRGSSRTVDADDMYELYEENTDVFSAMSPTVSVMGQVKNGTDSDSFSSTSVTGVSEQYDTIGKLTLTEGRFLTYSDLENRSKVAVCGSYLNRSVFGGKAVGQTLKVNGNIITIVGVLDEKDDSTAGSSDDCLYLPYTTASNLTFGAISSFTFATHDSTLNSRDTAILENKLYSVFQNSDYYTVSDMQSIVDSMNEMTSMMTMVLVGIAGISLLVGGIGIMNIMLVSVTERTREIGIRMAIGARKRDIIGQFLVEAAVVSCCGGIIGIVLGCFASAVLGRFMLARQLQQNMYLPNVEQFTVLPSVGLVLGAFLFSALLGIIFGLYPANKASNLQPVDALRTQ